MELFYREKGTAEQPPLLILHGLWGASENWLPIAEKLSDNFHVYLPDLRNHGRSPHSSRIDYECLTEDLRSFIETLHIPIPLYLVGHSMGGKIVLNFLLKYPDLVEKAVVIDIAPINYPPSQDHLRLLNFILKTDLSTYTNRNAITRHIARYFPKEEDRQLLLKNIGKTDKGYRWKVNASALQQNLSQLCNWPVSDALYQKEILFIKGEKSDYIPELGSLQIQFPHALLKTISQAGHRIHSEQPGSLTELIRHFFNH